MPALLSERRGHFRAGRRLEFESRRRNRRTRLVRIRSDDPVAVRQQHVRAFDSELVVDSQIKLLKHSFHRSGARQQLQFVAAFGLSRSDVEAGFDVFQIQRGIDRSHRRIQWRTFT